jgi:hypothetical protein
LGLSVIDFVVFGCDYDSLGVKIVESLAEVAETRDMASLIKVSDKNP